MNRKNDGIAEPLTICIIETEKTERTETTDPLSEDSRAGVQNHVFSRYSLLAGRLRTKLKKLNAKSDTIILIEDTTHF